MWDSLIKLVAGALLAATIAAVIYNWDDIRDSVANWLRNNNLEASALMGAWIKFDKFMGEVRSRVFIETTTQSGRQEIEETEKKFSEDQLKKEAPDVYSELQRRGYAWKDIMNQIPHR